MVCWLLWPIPDAWQGGSKSWVESGSLRFPARRHVPVRPFVDRITDRSRGLSLYSNMLSQGKCPDDHTPPSWAKTPPDARYPLRKFLIYIENPSRLRSQQPFPRMDTGDCSWRVFRQTTTAFRLECPRIDHHSAPAFCYSPNDQTWMAQALVHVVKKVSA